MATSKNEVSGWVGWIGFASMMLLILGMVHLIAGFAGLFRDDIYLLTENALFTFDYSQWGWIHMIGGALTLLAAGSLMQGKAYGRIFATLIALGSLVTNVVFLPVYPWWSLLMIVVSILVIWAVTVHGKELQG